ESFGSRASEMSASVEYRLFIDNSPITRDLYDEIDTITVEQSLDMVAEARIELQMCMNERGMWSGRGERHAQPYRRVRIEVRNMSSSWVPLIEGESMAANAGMSGDPGQSTVTIVVRDDSMQLNRKIKSFIFLGKSDLEAVRELFKEGGIEDI